MLNFIELHTIGEAGEIVTGINFDMVTAFCKLDNGRTRIFYTNLQNDDVTEDYDTVWRLMSELKYVHNKI